MSTGEFLLAISPVCVAVERVMSNDKDCRPVKKGLRCTSQESALPCRRLGKGTSPLQPVVPLVQRTRQSKVCRTVWKKRKKANLQVAL
ncbi:hypothetical protein IG631_03840 [Alternaria alternata]|nr:hypothetical protein IG631_03840 [Alternaria alternata]